MAWEQPRRQVDLQPTDMLYAVAGHIDAIDSSNLDETYVANAISLILDKMGYTPEWSCAASWAALQLHWDKFPKLYRTRPDVAHKVGSLMGMVKVAVNLIEKGKITREFYDKCVEALRQVDSEMAEAAKLPENFDFDGLLEHLRQS